MDLRNIRRTCLEMLRDRGYQIDKEDVEMSGRKFVEKFATEPDPENVRRDAITILASKADDPTHQAFVFFFEDPKLGVKAIKAVAVRMRDERVPRSILVLQDKLTPFAKQCIQEMSAKFAIEVFAEGELRVNITRHSMVPQHQVLSRLDKAALLERYKVKDTQLPRIQHQDPVARYLGLERGQVVRIVRGSETAGRYVTYRLCV
ncbi:hypothetical protein CHLNCDRAFT_48698 [Chlorella variabilis]|uniref:DNA-directed RNA polymerases I, II, and III subunit RPABC1 n=1 Tax=Chlorella variabilis TaxID=554065 RepID=E1ZAD9_CHLVA|nr:hypothetical protein CHLNCDRAFT_48698 [Chlorella variabilis]EFN57043.1 hypothetical protein CHLNCDRAFT_48698 [Chlorella variabilis]|eukprot:XP_005849145.1 hypothetical protein CHLNCDRAFT_48698 [Chlorella variabilis]